jgi:hypothetical protein
MCVHKLACRNSLNQQGGYLLTNTILFWNKNFLGQIVKLHGYGQSKPVDTGCFLLTWNEVKYFSLLAYTGIFSCPRLELCFNLKIHSPFPFSPFSFSHSPYLWHRSGRKQFKALTLKDLSVDYFGSAYAKNPLGSFASSFSPSCLTYLSREHAQAVCESLK